MLNTVLYLLMLFWLQSCANTEIFKCPGLCKCNRLDFIVDCTNKNLTQCPEDVPPQTKELFLDKNFLRNLTKRCVKNLQHLAKLTVTRNRDLRFVQTGLFRHLPNLKTINFSETAISPKDFQKHVLCGLNNTSIETIVADGLRLHEIYDGFFDCLAPMNVTTLSLVRNEIDRLNNASFTGLSSLKTLKIGWNYFTVVNTIPLRSLTRLKTMNIENCYLRNVPDFCKTSSSLTLEKLDFSYNSLYEFGNLPCLKRLETLELDKNNFRAVSALTFHSVRTSLKLLSLRRNQLQKLGYGAFNSTSLENLNLCCNNFMFKRIHKELFRFVPNLKKLIIGGNRIHYLFQKSFFNDMFKYLPLLNSLDISEMNIRWLPDKAFQHMSKLTVINLDDNDLLTVYYTSFWGLSSLNHLTMGGNRISTFERSYLPHRVWESLQLLHLANNPWACDCRLRWFRHFLANTTIKIPSQDGFKCFSPPSRYRKNLFDFHPKFTDCNIPERDYILYSVSILFGLLIFLSTISPVLYRFRWDIRYFTYITYMKKEKTKRKPEDVNDSFKYDAFISYHHDEYCWIRDILIPKLEDEGSFTCCVHDRDWLLGEDIFNNIERSIHESRKIIFVVTNAFAVSNWCQIELSIAQTHSLQCDKDKIILIFLEDVAQENLTPRLVYQMKTRTYVEWTVNTVGQELFWKKLKTAMNDPSQSVKYDD